MSEWDWVGLIALVGVSFLAGRWNGIRAFEKEWDRLNRMKYECKHGIDSRHSICLECEVRRVQEKHEDSRKTQ